MMFVLPVVVGLGLMSGTVLGAGNLTAILAKYPSCATNCAATTLTATQCPLTDLVNCLCANNTVQYEVAICVRTKCPLEDQLTATTITQDELCFGIPQPSRRKEIITACIIIGAIAYPFVALRFIARVFLTRSVWWDDWAMLVTVLFMIPNTTTPIYTTFHGFGVHFWAVPIANIPMLQKLFYFSSLCYVLIQNLPKFSILLLYLRIFPSQRFRLLVKIALVWQACHTIAFLFAVAFQCIPVSTFWQFGGGQGNLNGEAKGKCVNQQLLPFVGAGFSIMEDFVIMLLPIIELRGLGLSVRKRVQVGLMFAVGSFACVTSMMRLKYLIDFGTSLDGTWNNVNIVIWSMIETYTAVICACLMTIRPLLVKLMPGFFPSSVDRSAESSNKKRSTNWGRKFTSERSGSGYRLSGDEPLHEFGDGRVGIRKGGGESVVSGLSGVAESESIEMDNRGVERENVQEREVKERIAVLRNSLLVARKRDGDEESGVLGRETTEHRGDGGGS